ncbi:hypothetical protein F4804DRAFT_330645 [Jackrogersella minutella]|nr:hypothetical protein F4804DRAFT_330645 [Jackrogersella minutella]
MANGPSGGPAGGAAGGPSLGPSGGGTGAPPVIPPGGVPDIDLGGKGPTLTYDQILRKGFRPTTPSIYKITGIALGASMWFFLMYRAKKDGD